jgi:hypothetical protein
MKKIIIAGMLLAAGYSLCAQQSVAYNSQTVNSTGNYKTPEPIKMHFQTYYPGTTMATWQSNGEVWRATYKGDNRITHIYYNSTPYYLEHPVSYKLVLPVTNTYVPDRVIEAAINSYGDNLYSITLMKGTDGNEVYQVCLLENGNAKNVWMNAESTVFTDVNKVRTTNQQEMDNK